MKQLLFLLLSLSVISLHGQTKITVGGGSGGVVSVFPTQQAHTTGTTVTVTSQTTDIWLVVNPTTLLATLAVTTPATPVDGQRLDISFGGTITSGAVVTSFTLTPNSGQTVLVPPTGVIEAGETISFRYKTSLTRWFRLQ